MTKSDQAMRPLFEWMNTHPGVNLTANNFESSKPLFDTLGSSFDDMVNELNSYVALAQQRNNSDIIGTGQLLVQMKIFKYILLVSPFVYCTMRHYLLIHRRLSQIFDAVPDEQSLLSAKMDVFVSADPSNTTEINRATFEDIHNDILKGRGSSVLWFYPAAVGTPSYFLSAY